MLASVGGATLPVGSGLDRAIEKLMKQICPVPEEIRRLTTTVNRIRAVLEDAEKEISSDAVRLWLGEVKEVLLDAEDLIDELTTDAALQSMGAHGGKKVGIRTSRGVSNSGTALLAVMAVMMLPNLLAEKLKNKKHGS